MNPLIEDIITELRGKYKLSRYDLERIIDSQFKYTVEHIEASKLDNVKWMHLGKIRPSDYYEHKIKRENEMVEKI
jgi:hypothetical protein